MHGEILGIHSFPDAALLEKIASDGVTALNQHFQERLAAALDGDVSKIGRYVRLPGMHRQAGVIYPLSGRLRGDWQGLTAEQQLNFARLFQRCGISHLVQGHNHRPGTTPEVLAVAGVVVVNIAVGGDEPIPNRGVAMHPGYLAVRTGTPVLLSYHSPEGIMPITGVPKVQL
ncbi:MAG: hypothetical protein HGA19_13625 [Oscillochloris sp.]|nr:hypothetical protein [Oscillochloris sp.]